MAGPIQIQRENLSDQVAQYLCGYIAQNRLKPGDSLPSEMEVTRELRVSRGIVREAIRSLAASGFIDVSSGKRTRVSPLREDILSRILEHGIVTNQVTLEQILEFRQALECNIAGLAAERRSDEDLAAMRATVAHMSEEIVDIDAFIHRDLAFHFCIARAARNPLFTLLITSLRKSVEASIRQGFLRNYTPEGRKHIIMLHQALVDAFASQNPEQAVECMKRHFTDDVDDITAGNQRDEPEHKT